MKTKTKEPREKAEVQRTGNKVEREETMKKMTTEDLKPATEEEGTKVETKVSELETKVREILAEGKWNMKKVDEAVSRIMAVLPQRTARASKSLTEKINEPFKEGEAVSTTIGRLLMEGGRTKEQICDEVKKLHGEKAHCPTWYPSWYRSQSLMKKAGLTVPEIVRTNRPKAEKAEKIKPVKEMTKAERKAHVDKRNKELKEKGMAPIPDESMPLPTVAKGTAHGRKFTAGK